MDLKAVGQRIKAAREAKNLTQEETGSAGKFKYNTCQCDRERTKSNKIGYLCSDSQCT